MGSKKIQISPDAGTTYYTFPGSSGELSSEAGSIDDTIFGANFKSMQAGMIAWTLQTNGYYKGFAGYVAKILKMGTPVTMTGEALTRVGSTNTYVIANAAHAIISKDDVVTFKDGGTPILPANIVSVDYLFGQVTLTAPAGGSVTVDAKYVPTAAIARATGFTLNQTADSVDDTDFATAQSNSGHRAYIAGLKTASLSLNGIMSGSNDWRTSLVNRETIVVEINPDGNSKSVARGYFMYTTVGESGNVGAQETATATLPLQVPDVGNMSVPFEWMHDSTTTLNIALRTALQSWVDGTVLKYKYLRDGTNGYSGAGIITEISLAGGLEVMNEFVIHVQGSGSLTAVP